MATSSYKGVRIYALDEGAAQVARVMDTRAEVARMIGPPDRKKKKKKAGAVKEGVDGEGEYPSSDDSGDESDTEDSSSSDSDSTSSSDSDSDSDSDTSSSSSDGDELTRRAMAMSLRDDSPRNRAP